LYLINTTWIDYHYLERTKAVDKSDCQITQHDATLLKKNVIVAVHM